MKRILIVLAVIAIIAVAVLAYSFFRKPEAASGPIEAVPIATTIEELPPTEVAAPQVEATQEASPTTAAEPAAETVEATQEAPSAEATQPTGTVVEAATEAPQPNEKAAAATGLFEIVSAESEARFVINEVLRGAPTTVVGSTDQVAGQIALDPTDLSTAQVGTVQVNARTLATDNQFRNRAIKNRILRTDDYEFVTFVPKEIVGLPESGTVGETYTFQIVGDLTVTDVTREVTFDVTVTPVTETRIEGVATTAFLYTDFELAIPDAPAVDTVEDEVRLEFAFVAEALP
jgi:polyisoprenoid-binding protein YceI